MDTRSTRRDYRRPELVSLGQVEVETKGTGGIADESEMPKRSSF